MAFAGAKAWGATRASAKEKDTLATGSATTEIIIVHAVGTVVIVAVKKVLNNSSTARSANAQILLLLHHPPPPRSHPRTMAARKQKAVKKKCVTPLRKGDGFCNDANNHCGCNWDGGDCCGAKSFKYCTQCKCLDCKYVAKGDGCPKIFQGLCKKPLFKGDGRCDDGNNVAGCAWDGGDCCGARLVGVLAALDQR